jgi:hypothetical protein
MFSRSLREFRGHSTLGNRVSTSEVVSLMSTDFSVLLHSLSYMRESSQRPSCYKYNGSLSYGIGQYVDGA